MIGDGATDMEACPPAVSLVPRPFSCAHAREGKEGSGK